MCGAAKEQEAAEENGHGFFTRALVEGMAGKADINKDGQVELYELQAYVNLRCASCRQASRSRRSRSPRSSDHSPCRNRKRSEAYFLGKEEDHVGQAFQPDKPAPSGWKA